MIGFRKGDLKNILIEGSKKRGILAVWIVYPNCFLKNICSTDIPLYPKNGGGVGMFEDGNLTLIEKAISHLVNNKTIIVLGTV